MSTQANALKVTGISSPRHLADIFASHLVDVAYIAHTELTFAIVKPDDPSVLLDDRDPTWLQRVVLSTLHSNGELTAATEPCFWDDN